MVESNLIELLRVCAEKDNEFMKLKDEAAILNPFYTDTRYPVHWPINLTKKDAIRASRSAKLIADFVKVRLKKLLQTK